jgi:hypothetical protein
MKKSNDFLPILRFAVMSDIHYKDEHTIERERFASAMKAAYSISEGSDTYKNLDALFIVGDFANRGSEIQMQAFKKSLDDNIRERTDVTVSVASHEFNAENGGEAAALERLGRIFGMEPDVHKVINGFHFISVSSTKGCRFDKEKQNWVKRELRIAAADDHQKPIFFFQHPHISGTVYGSINWGEDDLTPILMNYPQIIDFSGHSHAPINDPRSIHQKYFTSLGTGTLSYFELDEFDKIYGTVPPKADNAAQMLIVEADKYNRVRVYPYDVLSNNYFPFIWKIDCPSDPSTFIYTDERYNSTVLPYFRAGAKITVSDISFDSCKITFNQASIESEYVDDYNIIIKRADTGLICRQISVWSEYYFYYMPETLSVEVDSMDEDTQYIIEIYANSFWKKRSKEPLIAEFKTLKQ